MRTVNQAGLDLIQEFEGFKAKSYKCSAGVWTIGYGSTYWFDGRKVRQGETIDKETAFLLLNHSLKEKCQIVDNYLNQIKLKLNENQFSALMSFAYNLGVGPIVSGGRSMNQAIKTHNTFKIADTFMIYCKSRNSLGIKIELPGLKRRREAERNLFLLG